MCVLMERPKVIQFFSFFFLRDGDIFLVEVINGSRLIHFLLCLTYFICFIKRKK